MNKISFPFFVLAMVVASNADLITRSEWGAKSPKITKKFSAAARYVVVHHSDQLGGCSTSDACKSTMKSIQNYHMKNKNWDDIGYSFAVGGDGNIYEARGYNIIGSHAPGYNSKSLGLVFIGNFQSNTPSAKMITAAKNFIADSVKLGKLSSNYKLVGHRQVRSTDCPGDALYNEIKTWDNWTSTP